MVECNGNLVYRLWHVIQCVMAPIYLPRWLRASTHSAPNTLNRRRTTYYIHTAACQSKSERRLGSFGSFHVLYDVFFYNIYSLFFTHFGGTVCRAPNTSLQYCYYYYRSPPIHGRCAIVFGARCALFGQSVHSFRCCFYSFRRWNNIERVCGFGTMDRSSPYDVDVCISFRSFSSVSWMDLACGATLWSDWFIKKKKMFDAERWTWNNFTNFHRSNWLV